MSATTVEEKTEDKAEQKDRDLPLAELVAKVGAGVLGNPFLSAFISAAPSPKAADDEMVCLGWPNELARRIRLGVHLYNRCRQHGKNLWCEMTKVTTRIADQMFEFDWQPDNLDFGSDVLVKGSSVFKFDTFKTPQQWPFFLREFRLDTVKWGRNGYRTSVDGTGLGEYDWQNGFEVVHDLFDPEDHDLNTFGSVADSFAEEVSPGQVLHLSTSLMNVRSAFFTIEDTRDKGDHRDRGDYNLRLQTKTVMLSTKQDRLYPRNFPHLYKIVEIDMRHEDGEQTVNEKVRVLLRRDLGPKIRHDLFMNEWVTYKRTVCVSQKVEVLLEARYQVFPNASHPRYLQRVDRDAEPVRVRMQHDGIRTQEGHLTDVKIGQTVKKCLVVADRLFSCSVSEVPLERVVGLSLATNPPKELADLFVREPEVAKT